MTLVSLVIWLCQIKNGSYTGWFISSWWCAPHIFICCSIALSCFLTIYNIFNSMIPVPYILLYSYLRSIYYFRMRINLTDSVATYRFLTFLKIVFITTRLDRIKSRYIYSLSLKDIINLVVYKSDYIVVL